MNTLALGVVSQKGPERSLAVGSVTPANADQTHAYVYQLEVSVQISQVTAWAGCGQRRRSGCNMQLVQFPRVSHAWTGLQSREGCQDEGQARPDQL
jgi:hypothetical protein